MRILVFLLAALAFSQTVLAAGSWDTEARHGYAVTWRPEVLRLQMSEDGSLVSMDPRLDISFWGGSLIDETFEAEIGARLDLLGPSSWLILEKIITPEAASFWGSKGKKAVAWRAIALCNGTHFAGVQIEFPLSMLGEIKPAFDELMSGVKPTACSN